MMTNEELSAIETRANKASTGPWTIEAGSYSGSNWPIGHVAIWLGASVEDGNSYTVTTDCVHASQLEGDARTDAEFFAHARTDVPALLAEVKHLRADLDLALGWLEIATNGVSARDLLQMADVAVEVRRRWGLDADGGQTRHE